MAWPPACYQRATAFVTDPAHRLLVFDHADDPTVVTWVREDCDGGTAVVNRYAFRWADLDTAAATAAVRNSIEHPNQ